MTSQTLSGEGIDLEAIQARLTCDYAGIVPTGTRLKVMRQDIRAMLAALIRLRGAQQEETAHEDLARSESFPK